MKIWVDADACPVVVKDLLFKAVERTGVPLTLVANQTMRIPQSDNVDFLLVASGFDIADNEIIDRLAPGDLVITGDIPLAASTIEKGGHALNPRGELYSADTIRSRLSVRDFMDSLRGSGVDTGGPPPLDQRDRELFANQLDKILTKYQKSMRMNKRDSKHV